MQKSSTRKMFGQEDRDLWDAVYPCLLVQDVQIEIMKIYFKKHLIKLDIY